MTRMAVRGIVIMDGKLLLMRRVKNGKEYWVIPGGGMEEGENYEETVVREMEEEVGISVRPIREIIRVEFLDPEEYVRTKSITNSESIARIYLPGWSAVDIFYLCEYISGEVGSGAGVEFMERSSADNIYEVQLVSKNELCQIQLVPEEIKTYLESLLP